MNQPSARRPSRFALLLLAAALPACGRPPVETDPGGGGEGEGEGSVGVLELALSSVPGDAGCLRVIVAGSRTVTRQFELSPGPGASFTLDRLPIGTVRVDASAFPGACAAPGAAPTTEASWVSEAPVDAHVLPLVVAKVALRLIRNGRAAVSVDFERDPWIYPGRAPIDLAIFGDSPYGAAQVTDFPNLVAHINAAAGVSAVVHVGDIKNGSTRCDTSYFQNIAAAFASFQDPLVYTPGDNEWTDCHRANNGAFDPLERLAVLRQTFFPVPGLALGGGYRQVATQAAVTGRETFVENQLWLEAGVAFSAVHVVGSNNNLAPWFGDDTTGTKADDPARRQAEVAARIAAAVDWLERSFALASAEQAAGVAVLMQADTWTGADTSPHDGFDAVIRKLADLTRAFGKPVLLVQGDSHVYKTDNPLAAGSARYGITQPVPNLVRIVVQGETASEWLRLHVDPASPSVFSWQRVMR